MTFKKLCLGQKIDLKNFSKYLLNFFNFLHKSPKSFFKSPPVSLKAEAHFSRCKGVMEHLKTFASLIFSDPLNKVKGNSSVLCFRYHSTILGLSTGISLPKTIAAPFHSICSYNRQRL